MNMMKWKIGMALVLILTILNTTSAATIEIELVGQYDTSGYASDVVVVGNYAYIADNIGGLCIVDISDPSDPTIEGILATGESLNSVTVRDNYAYATASAFKGFFIFDISKPSNPIKIGENRSIDAKDVVVSGNYAYLAGYSGLYVVDISNPSNPTKVGEYTVLGHAHSVFILGNYAYVTDFHNGLYIIDISNPFNPIKVGQYTGGEFFRSVVVSGNYAYVATTGSYGLCVLDVSDKSNPIRINQYPEGAHDLKVSGDYAYIITSGGLHVIDMSQSPPVEIGRYNAPLHDLTLSGNYAYITSSDEGLYIFKIDITPDTTPPTMTINQPSEGQVFTRDTIIVSGSASDESVIQSVTVNGEYTIINVTKRIDWSGSFHFPIYTTSWSQTITLSPGTNTVTIKATDTIGNTKTIHRTVTYLNTGSVFISSEPSGASIYLDGEYKGTTPKTISDVSAGYHTIKLNKEGYQSWSISVHVTSGATETVSASMSVIPVAAPTIIPTKSPTPISTPAPAFTPTPTPMSALVDSDGDGTPDKYDYAPYDPNVQTESDSIPEATPTPKPPGFDVIFAIIGLLTIAYLLRRRR